MYLLRLAIASLILVACGDVGTTSVSQPVTDNPPPTEKPGPRKSGFYDFFNASSEFSPGVGQTSNVSCTVTAATQPSVYAGNNLLDCDGEVPHNETTIAVDPTDDGHVAGGYHSYQLSFTGATDGYES